MGHTGKEKTALFSHFAHIESDILYINKIYILIETLSRFPNCFKTWLWDAARDNTIKPINRKFLIIWSFITIEKVLDSETTKNFMA